MLTIFGSINVDQFVRVVSIPAPGETVLGERVMAAHGGKGANQAVAAARASSGETPVAMIGAVGDDAHGVAVRQNLAENAVVAELATLPDCETGTALITLSDDGENAITVIPGANNHLSHVHASSETLERTSVLLCQGEARLEETVRVMASYRDRRQDGSIVLNLAPVPAESDVQVVKDALRGCNFLIVNEPEAEAVSRILATDAPVGLSYVARQYGCSIVITRGAEGSALITPSGETSSIPSPRIDPVDTTGAGDTFCGVFAVLLAEGRDVLHAMIMACRAAAKACGAVGAQVGMPRRAEFLKEIYPL